MVLVCLFLYLLLLRLFDLYSSPKSAKLMSLNKLMIFLQQKVQY